MLSVAEYIERKQVIDWIAPFIHTGDSIDAEDMMWYVRELPAADVAPVRHELQKAVKMLANNYERGLNSDFVRDPLAWVLYQTWKGMGR